MLYPSAKSEIIKTGVSYFGNRNTRHYVVDLEEIISHNCNFVLHTYSENDQLFYHGSIAEMIDISKKAGLEVYLDPWGVGRIFGGEAFSDFALKNPDMCQVFFDGQTAPAACVNHPVVFEFLLRWIDDAIALGVDTIFWDEPHFYVDWKREPPLQRVACYCKSCQAKYTRLFGEKMPHPHSEEFLTFREDSLIEFLALLCSYVKSKGAKNAICLQPQKDKIAGIFDWEKVATISSLDIVSCNPYWIVFNRDLDYVAESAHKVVKIAQANDKIAQIWIQNFRIPKGREGEIVEGLALAYAEGVRNFGAWSFDGTSSMSYIRCDNPKYVWDLLGSAYGKIMTGEWD